MTSRVSPALSFGRVANEYERVRPDYPAAAVDRAVDALGLGATGDVVDLAAGTGKLTRLLAKRFGRVLAVEPDDSMRSVLERVVPGVEARAGTAERMPLPTASADAVFVADAFHWFDAPVALREIARVLRPRGGLALLTNEWWETEPPVPARMLDLLREPFVRSGRAAAVEDGEAWRRAFADSAFEPLRGETFVDEVVVSADELVALYVTTSSIASLPAGEREELAGTLRSLLDGTYGLPTTVEVFWTRLA